MRVSRGSKLLRVGGRAATENRAKPPVPCYLALGMRGLTPYVVLALVAAFAVFALWPPRPGPGPSLPREACLRCHDEAKEGPGGLHSALADCEACHLGDPAADQLPAAHAGLEREPGALDTVERTCGRGGCHPSQAARMQRSIMTTARGLIAVDRWAFGELAEPTSEETMQDLLTEPSPSPAQDHLRKLCAGCHLGTRKANRDDMLVGLASGCSACHATPKPDPTAPHPILDAATPDRRCFGCHSRSGRVSLSYAGLREVRGEDSLRCSNPIELADGREACATAPDVHGAAGMACIDCHLHTEVMGDGTSYAHEEQQTEVRCESCHGPAGALETSWGEIQDGTSRRLLVRHGLEPAPSERVRTGARGTPLFNLRRLEDGWWLTSKLGAGRWRVPVTPEDPQHRLRGHERLSCASCHAAWAPTCPTCHTSYEPTGQQWDFAAGAETAGRWVERAERYFAEPPTLAVRADRVVPAAPGMISTLEHGAESRSGRWFAAFDPHTTGPEARPCASCHGAPEALGLGHGRLELGALPRFVPEGDDATQGAWQSLFGPPGAGTRPDVAGLDEAAQRRVLTVAACLPCHADAGASIYRDFEASLDDLAGGRRPACRGRYEGWMRAVTPR